VSALPPEPILVPLPFQREPGLRRWRRRALSIGGTIILAALLLALFPLALLVGLGVGLTRRNTRLGLFRTYLAATWAAVLEVYGATLLTLAWVASVGSAERLGRLTRRVQTHWTLLHVAALQGIFNLQIEADGIEQVRPRPTIMLMRHSSMLDTILPPALLVPAHDTVLRYVLKSELLTDPCLDIAGNRIPNLFLRRGVKDEAAKREIGNLRELAATTTGNTAIVLFPEGTRVTTAKRDRAIDRLRAAGSSQRHLFAAAQRLSHLMPIRLGGAMALLEGSPDADVVFVAHTGLDQLTGFSSLTSGKLVGATVRVRFWRSAIPRPTDAEATEHWLLDRWQEVDDAVGAMKG